MAYKTDTTFDSVLDLLQETEVVSERVVKKLWEHVYVLKYEIGKLETYEERLELFEKKNDEFYDDVQIYEPIFSKSFRIWLLRSFRKLELELCHQN